MRTRRIALAVAALFVGAGLLWAQNPSTPPSRGHGEGMHGHMMSGSTMGETPEGGATMADCQAMMAKRQAMMDEMHAMDARLDELVAKMNAASGDAKLDATAAVVTELAAQRQQMRSMMQTMQPMMMRHMAKHLQAGMQGSMGDCPMMGGAEAAESGHEAHH